MQNEWSHSVHVLPWCACPLYGWSTLMWSTPLLCCIRHQHMGNSPLSPSILLPRRPFGSSSIALLLQTNSCSCLCRSANSLILHSCMGRTLCLPPVSPLSNHPLLKLKQLPTLPKQRTWSTHFCSQAKKPQKHVGTSKVCLNQVLHSVPGRKSSGGFVILID